MICRFTLQRKILQARHMQHTCIYCIRTVLIMHMALLQVLWRMITQELHRMQGHVRARPIELNKTMQGCDGDTQHIQGRFRDRNMYSTERNDHLLRRVFALSCGLHDLGDGLE